MTTIAWDGETVAADKQSSQGDIKWFKEKKLFRFGDVVATYAGREDYGNRFLAWVQDGMDPEGFPDFPAKDDAFDLVGLVFKEDRVLEFCDNGTAAPRPKPFAWGSGAKLALGALLAGKSPKDAVRIASQHDLYSGGGVQSMAVKKS